MGLQASVLMLLAYRRRLGAQPWLVAWLVYDLCFSVALYVINWAGGARTVYPAVWQWLQPADVALMGYVAIEAMGLAEVPATAMVAATMGVGLTLSTDHRIMTMSAFVCFIVSVALVSVNRGAILAVYAGAMSVQHMSVLWHEQRWRAGAFSQVVTVFCLVAWLWKFRNRVNHRNLHNLPFFSRHSGHTSTDFPRPL